MQNNVPALPVLSWVLLCLRPKWGSVWAYVVFLDGCVSRLMDEGDGVQSRIEMNDGNKEHVTWKMQRVSQAGMLCEVSRRRMEAGEKRVCPPVVTFELRHAPVNDRLWGSRVRRLTCVCAALGGGIGSVWYKSASRDSFSVSPDDSVTFCAQCAMRDSSASHQTRTFAIMRRPARLPDAINSNMHTNGVALKGVCELVSSCLKSTNICINKYM